MEEEEWKFRAGCPECSNVIWSADRVDFRDLPDGTTEEVVTPAPKTVCVCGSSWIEEDGSLGGNATDVNDGQMMAFIKSDHGRNVSLKRSQGRGRR